MTLQRRDLLKLALPGLVLPRIGLPTTMLAGFGLLSGCSNEQPSTRYYSAVKQKGKDYIAGFNHQGEINFLSAVEQRCHGGAYNAVLKQSAWAARSPGNVIFVLDDQGEILHKVKSQPGCHFFGHSQYSPDGKFLFTTENDYLNGFGSIAVYAVDKDYQFLRRYSSGGIGPHELRFLSDGRHLVIANGGIKTHPESKQKLNLESMQPSLVIMDSLSGEIVKQLFIADSKLSIRHLAVNKKDQIAVLTQYQKTDDFVETDNEVSLVYSWQPGAENLTALPALWSGFESYMASGALSDQGILAATTPRGNRLAFWDINQNKWLAVYKMKDVAGIALSPDGQSFIASSGRGRLWQFSAATAQPLTEKAVRVSGLGWDNHMLAV